MAVKIEDVIAGKGEQDRVQVEGVGLSVAKLKALAEEGYEYATFFADCSQFAFWGKACSACFTAEHLQG